MLMNKARRVYIETAQNLELGKQQSLQRWLNCWVQHHFHQDRKKNRSVILSLWKACSAWWCLGCLVHCYYFRLKIVPSSHITINLSRYICSWVSPPYWSLGHVVAWLISILLKFSCPTEKMVKMACVFTAYQQVCHAVITISLSFTWQHRTFSIHCSAAQLSGGQSVWRYCLRNQVPSEFQPRHSSFSLCVLGSSPGRLTSEPWLATLLHGLPDPSWTARVEQHTCEGRHIHGRLGVLMSHVQQTNLMHTLAVTDFSISEAIQQCLPYS